MSSNNNNNRPSIIKPNNGATGGQSTGQMQDRHARIPPLSTDYRRPQQQQQQSQPGDYYNRRPNGPNNNSISSSGPARQRIVYNNNNNNNNNAGGSGAAGTPGPSSVFDGRRLGRTADSAGYYSAGGPGGSSGKRPRLLMQQQQQQPGSMNADYRTPSSYDRSYYNNSNSGAGGQFSGQQQRRLSTSSFENNNNNGQRNHSGPSGSGGGINWRRSSYGGSGSGYQSNQYRPTISNRPAVDYFNEDGFSRDSSFHGVTGDRGSVESSPSAKGPLFVAHDSPVHPDVVRVRAMASSSSRSHGSGGGSSGDDISTDGDDDDDEDVGTSENDEDVEADEERDGGMTKEKITDSMDLIDDEISKYESLLETIQRQKREAELRTSSRPASPVLSMQPASPMVRGDDSAAASPRITKASGFDEVNLVHRILKENRAKAKKASSLAQLKVMPATTKPHAPVYTKPSDLPFYQENLDNHELIRSQLIKQIRDREERILEKTLQLSMEFDTMYRTWQEHLSKWEANQRKKQDKLIGKQGLQNFKKRMMIAHQTEEQPLNHLAMGDYDPTILPFTYLFPHEDFRFLKTLAKVPDMIMDDRQRTEIKYVDNNRVFEDSLQSIRNRNNLNPWTFAEKEIYLQRFIEFPKQFGKIAAYLPNKTAQDCVLFYYLNKKPLKLKSMIKAHNNHMKKLQKKNQLINSGSRESLPIPALPAPNYDQHPHDQMDTMQTSQSPVPMTGDIPPANPSLGKYVEFEESFWDPSDLQRTKEMFLDIGKDFAKISEMVGSKSILQVRNLFLAYKRDLGIDLSSAESIADGGSRNERKRSKQLRDRSRQASIAPDIIVEEPAPPKVKIEKAPTIESAPPSATVSNIEKIEKKKSIKRGRPTKPNGKPQGDEDQPESPGKVNTTSDTEAGKKDKKKHISYWTAKEKGEFLKHFTVHGRNWKALADALPTKSENQIRNYYQNNKVILGLNTGERSDQDEDSSKEGRRGASDQEDAVGGLPPMNLGYVLPHYPYPYPGPAPPPLTADGTRYQPPSFPMYPPPIYTQGAPRPPPFMANPFYPMPPPPMGNPGVNGGKNPNGINGDSKPFFPYGPLHFPHIAPQPMAIPSSIRPPPANKDPNTSPKQQHILPNPGPPELAILPVPQIIPLKSPPRPPKEKRTRKSTAAAAVEAKKEAEPAPKAESVPMEVDDKSPSAEQNETSQ